MRPSELTEGQFFSLSPVSAEGHSPIRITFVYEYGRLFCYIGSGEKDQFDIGDLPVSHHDATYEALIKSGAREIDSHI